MTDVLSIVISVLFGIGTWYWGTKRKRVFKAIKAEQEKIDKISGYASELGHKLMLRDCFHTLSYTLSIVFVSVGVCIFVYSYLPSPFLKLFFAQLLGSVFAASGLMLFEMFNDLSKTFKPEVSIKAMEEKLKKLKDEHENH
ncbi:MAG: hypothetical protein Q7T48_11485 [Cellvibrio sp.]|uniref:hypothetical protein n=1 Tax=Cellvibrio sp. TaxID=1965322 RepID=UPI00272200BA|nr:hypothetical protein [Cellvibrio sp.]